jgi:hypothetical protein
MQAQGNLPGMEKLTMTIIRTICAGILTLALASVAANAQQNVLLNPGFETASGIFTDQANTAIITPAAADWVQFANGLRTAATNQPVSTVHSGNWSLKCFGSTDWGGEGADEIIYNPGVSPGQQWVLSGYGLTTSSDPLTNPVAGTTQPYGTIQLNFLLVMITTNNGVYTTNSAVLTGPFSPPNFTGAITDEWQFGSVTATAPARANALQVYVMELGYGGFSSGSIFFDDLSVVNLNATIVTNYWQEFIANGNQVCWVSDTNSTWQPQSSVNNSSWVNLGQPLQGDGNTDCVFDTGLSNKYYRVLQLQ